MLNISGYKFVGLTNLEKWQHDCLSQCNTLKLKGTVVWSHEGINVMLAGPADAIEAWITWLHTFQEFYDIQFKESESDIQPFGRMRVKIKKELVPGSIHPTALSAPAISPLELKAWYESKKDFVIIDARNNYEVKMGKFKNALDIQIETFNQFSKKIAALPAALREKPIVLYCTGGIRCEKAAPLALQAGFKTVYQLEGGILKYFEECGSAFYEGECFVFDSRHALQANLKTRGL